MINVATDGNSISYSISDNFQTIHKLLTVKICLAELGTVCNTKGNGKNIQRIKAIVLYGSVTKVIGKANVLENSSVFRSFTFHKLLPFHLKNCCIRGIKSFYAVQSLHMLPSKSLAGIEVVCCFL